MSELTDKMNAAIATLQSQHGVSTDQVNTIVAQAVAPLTASLQAAVNSEKDDAAKIADITAALDDFTAAFAPASQPAPDSAPLAPAPDAAPDSAPTAPAAA